MVLVMHFIRNIADVFQLLYQKVSWAVSVVMQGILERLGLKTSAHRPEPDQLSEEAGPRSISPTPDDYGGDSQDTQRHVAAGSSIIPRRSMPVGDLQVVLDDPYGHRQSLAEYGGDSGVHPARQLALNRPLTRSESNQSDLDLASLEPIDDRGRKAHMAWEQSLSSVSSKSNGETSRDDPKPGNHAENRAKYTADGSTYINGSRPAATPDALDSAAVGPISNKICRAFQRSAFNDRAYLPLDQLTEIITPTVVRSLLRTHFRDEATRQQMEEGMLGNVSGQSQWPTRRRIFAILILLKEVERISDFIQTGIDDASLPFGLQHTDDGEPDTWLLTNEEPARPFLRWPAKIAYDFTLYQQIIHVPFLKFPDEVIYFYSLHHEAILPFSSYKLHDSGGYSNVHQAIIHHAHHDNGRNKREQTSKFVAVKQLHVPNRENYIKEVRVFDKIRLRKDASMTNHLIPLQLTYKHGENYFLIFPWADGNLKAFWASQDPDCQREERVWWFFEQCVGITSGLRKIHHLGTLPKDNQGANKLDVKVLPKMVLHDDEWGRHSDIKPENILWFKEFDEKQDHLVISDFGLTRFNSAHSKSIVPPDQIQGYSPTYKPPDLHFNDGISQTYDVWSLGCVFLEFVSWFLLGGKSIDDFEHARTHDKLETQGDVLQDKFFALVFDAKQRQTAVLKQSVVKWIEKLHESPQCTEPLHSFLDLIQFTMLLTNSKNRWKCDRICSALQKDFQACKRDSEYALRPVSAFPNSKRHVSPNRPDPIERPLLVKDRDLSVGEIGSQFDSTRYRTEDSDRRSLDIS